MNVVSLSWYTAANLLLGSLLLSLISVAPGAETFFFSLVVAFLTGAAVAAITAVMMSRQPSDRWCHRSKLLLSLLFLIATASTIAVVLVG